MIAATGPAMTVQSQIDLTDTDSAALRPCDPALYRAVMGAFPTGVTVMTAGSDATRCGVTASSFNTVSLDPPLILWSLGLKAPSLSIFRSEAHFAVNVLSDAQKDMALHFARPSADKFAGVDTFTGLTGAPLIRGALAHIECRVWARHPGGDHEIMLGEIVALRRGDGTPLVFAGGAFHGLATL
jgi:flavin reductase (DIM6/NTAB) family NADH-FMN oxidoreductase RutF